MTVDTFIAPLQSRSDELSPGLVSAKPADHRNVLLGDGGGDFAQALQAAESLVEPYDSSVLAKLGLTGDGADSGSYAMAKHVHKRYENQIVKVDYSSPLAGGADAESLSHTADLGVPLASAALPLPPAAVSGTAALAQHQGAPRGELGRSRGEQSIGPVSRALDDKFSGETRFLNGSNAPVIGKTLPLHGLGNAADGASFGKRASSPAGNQFAEKTVNSVGSKSLTSELQLPLDTASGKTGAQASPINMPPSDVDTAAGRPLVLRAGMPGEMPARPVLPQAHRDATSLHVKQDVGTVSGVSIQMYAESSAVAAGRSGHMGAQKTSPPIEGSSGVITALNGGSGPWSGAMQTGSAALEKAAATRMTAKIHDVLAIRGGLIAGSAGVDSALNAAAVDVPTAHSHVGDARVGTSSTAVAMDGGQKPMSVLPGVLDMTKSPEEVSGQLGGRLIAMASDGQKSARIHLHPQELGAIDIRVRIDQDGTTLSINAYNGHAREAIEASLPRLREMFLDQGMNLLDVDVSSGQRDESARPDQRHAKSTLYAPETSKPDDTVGGSTLAKPTGASNGRRLDILA